MKRPTISPALAALLGLGGLAGCPPPVNALYGAPATDEDGDGYYDEVDDCDDTDASIHPGADDPEGDGIDQNCDGVDGNASDTGT
jgi:hypothetical protein